MLKAAADETQQKTGNAVQFKIYPGGVMGDERDMVRKMHIGQLQAAMLSSASLASMYPEIDVLQTPFLFDSYPETDFVVGKMEDGFKSGLEKNGYVALGWSEAGFVYLMSTVPVETLELLRKAKVWIWNDSPMSKAIFEEAGVIGVPLSISDVLVGLQTGLVEVVYVPPSVAVALQWFTRIKYITDAPLELHAGRAGGEKGGLRQNRPPAPVRGQRGLSAPHDPAEGDHPRREPGGPHRHAEAGHQAHLPGQGADRRLQGHFGKGHAEGERPQVFAQDKGGGFCLAQSLRGGQEVRFWERLDETIGRLEKALMVLFLGLMIVMAFAQIALRNFTGIGLPWSESLVRYLVLWVGFIGASLAAREGRHITIEVIKLRPSVSGRRYLAALSQFCAVLVCAVMTWAAVKFVRDDAQIGTRTFLDLPTWVLETIIPATFAIMSLRFLLRAIRALRREAARPEPAPPL